MTVKRYFWLGAGVMAFFIGPAFGQTASDTFSTIVSGDGTISIPENYREDMVFIGTWGIEGGEGEITSGFHNVYTSRDVVDHYQETGEFPDGAVLVKELLGAVSGRKTTGPISWGTDITGWFVMVKDREGRFPDNALWGNGWGWSLFNADDPANTVTTNFRVDCLGCHIPAKKDDWIFMEGYPLLTEGKE